MILKVKKKNQELRSNIAQLEQQLQEQKYMFKNT